MIEHAERLGSMLDELGPSTDEIVLIEQISPQAWLLALEEGGAAIAVRIDEATGVVTFSCELGRPQEAMRLRVYEALLTYNGLGDLHGGVRMGLRSPGDVVLQEFDSHIQSLNLTMLRQIIQDFSSKASAWEEIIESAEPEELDEALEAAPFYAIRG